MSDSLKSPMVYYERPYTLRQRRSRCSGSEREWSQASEQYSIRLGVSEPADTVAVDRNQMRATHNTFPFHDQAGAIAAARILMRMRNGQPDMTANACRHERDHGKVSKVVGRIATPRNQHFRFRCTVVTDDPKVEVRIEVTRKRKRSGVPCRL